MVETKANETHSNNTNVATNEKEQNEVTLDELDEVNIPGSYKKFKAHKFTITAASVTKRGHRIATGDSHGFVRLRDFKNLDVSGERFSEFSPVENHSVSVIEWSRDSKNILICNSEKSLRLFDSHMNSIVRTYKGDMYVRDLAQTMGHTHAINDAKWDPTDFCHFASASLDGSVRVWDINSKPQGLDRAIASLLVLKSVNHRGSCMSQDCSVTSITYLDGNNTIAGVCADGSIQIWDARLSGVKGRKSKAVNRSSHGSSMPMKICQTRGGERLFSRSADHLVRKQIFLALTFSPITIPLTTIEHDIRQFKHAVKSIEINCDNPKVPLLLPFRFGSLIVTMCKSPDSTTEIHYLDSETLNVSEKKSCPEVENSTVLECCESLDQIFVSDSSGEVFGFYDEIQHNRSHCAEGIVAMKDCELPQEKKRGNDEFEAVIDTSHSWYELPANIKQFRDGTIREIKPRRHVLRAEANPSLTRSQQFGESEPVLKMTMAQSVMKKFLEEEAAIRGDDSNWIDTLRRGGDSEMKPSDVSLVDRAYRKTQPTLILDTSEAVGGEKLLEGQRKCPQCGLKMCTCGYVALLTGGRTMDFSEHLSSKRIKKN